MSPGSIANIALVKYGAIVKRSRIYAVYSRASLISGYSTIGGVFASISIRSLGVTEE